MENILIASLIGAAVGWIGSVAMRTDTQSGILQDIGAGLFSGIVCAVAVGSSDAVDAFLSAALGATLVISCIAVMRRWALRG